MAANTEVTGGEDAQPAGPSSRVGVFTIAEQSARFDELALLTRQAVSTGEVKGGVEPQTPVQVGVTAAAGGPAFGGLSELLAGDEVGAFFEDPPVEAGPGAQQCFVGDGDLVVVGDEQARFGEGGDDVVGSLGVDVSDLVPWCPAAGVVALGPQFDHP
jgi:hypothetical protein